MRLSASQRTALSKMPFSMTYWGGRPFHSWPGKFTERTIDSLLRLGLAHAKKGKRLDTIYTRTAEGQKWLDEAGS
jgi:hypothetical protein